MSQGHTIVLDDNRNLGTGRACGGLRQLLELPEGAPRLREDFTFIWWLRVRVTRDQQQLNGLVLT